MSKYVQNLYGLIFLNTAIVSENIFNIWGCLRILKKSISIENAQDISEKLISFHNQIT